MSTVVRNLRDSQICGGVRASRFFLGCLGFYACAGYPGCEGYRDVRGSAMFEVFKVRDVQGFTGFRGLRGCQRCQGVLGDQGFQVPFGFPMLFKDFGVFGVVGVITTVGLLSLSRHSWFSTVFRVSKFSGLSWCSE